MTNTNPNHVRIDFTRTGWKQFGRLNISLGARFIRAFILKRELAEYIAAHENSGRHLDTECQEVRYEEGIYLNLRKMQGVWYIIDAFTAQDGGHFEPVYMWTQVKRGCSMLLTQMLIGWRAAIDKGIGKLAAYSAGCEVSA